MGSVLSVKLYVIGLNQIWVLVAKTAQYFFFAGIYYLKNYCLY